MSNRQPLVIKNVYKGYGKDETRVEILKGINLTIMPGEFVMLLGPSGSGKSTILHLVAGLTPPDQGEIAINGIDLATCTTNQMLQLRREELGYVFQDFKLLQGLTALENVMIPLIAVGQSVSAAKKRATEMLSYFGLAERLQYFPRKMSGGEQQRVGIARALANKPGLILADEPTGNLDQKLAMEVVETLANLAKETHTSILMVTHDPAMAKYATKVITLVNGHTEVVQRG